METMKVREAEIVYRSRTVESTDPAGIGSRVGSSADAARILSAWIGPMAVEHFVVLAISSRNTVKSVNVAGKGSSTFCPVSPADVLRFALLSGEPAFIVSHNHPGGDPRPSAEDIELTKRLRAAFDMVGLKLLDHIITTEACHFSFLDAGMMRTGA